MVFLLLQLEFDLLTILKYFHIIMLQNFELLTFPFFFCFYLFILNIGIKIFLALLIIDFCRKRNPV